MPISPENTIIVYRDGDSNSETVADAYVALYDLDDTTNVSVNAPTGQKVPISCSAAEILSSESLFNTQVLTPILNAITDLEANGFPVWCIVLASNVPGGFQDGGHVISSTSRLARIHHAYSRKTINKLYDRKVFKRFDGDDKEFCLVVSRLDAPTTTLAKGLVEKSGVIKRQLFVSGKFYFDPYSDKQGTAAQSYEDELVDFQTRILPQLNVDSWSTAFLDPYIDSIIPSVTGDSFIWSWFTDRSSMSFFRDTNAFRFFAYNADYDGAYTMRSVTERRWPVLSIRNGYAATAGAMSNPTIEGLLRPEPFFDALLRGGALGEAYLYSLPFLDWTMTLIGDPLMRMSFPYSNLLENNTITEDESWRLMFNDLAKAIAYSVRKTDYIEEMRNRIAFSNDLYTEVDLLQKCQQLLDTFSDARRQGQFAGVTEALITHIQSRIKFRDIFNAPNQKISDYLLEREQTVSELIYDVQQDNNRLIEANLSLEGSFEFEFPILDETGEYAFYQFELDVSDKADFSNILLSKSSLIDSTGWFYEKNANTFEPMSAGGVGSNFAGRKIKYVSSENEVLVRSDIYYVRLRQRDAGTFFPYQTKREIIYT